MNNDTTMQKVFAEIPVPNGFRAEWRQPVFGEQIYRQGSWVIAIEADCHSCEFVLVPIFAPPQWLLDSDYTSIRWNEFCKMWKLHIGECEWTPAHIHHDICDMLAKIDPKKTPVAWERGK